MKNTILTTLLAIALVAAPQGARAQQADDGGVSRFLFDYLGNTLTVEVLSPEAGEIHFMRGETGQIRVAANPQGGGFADAALVDGEGQLRLTAVGADRARYLVVVPEHTYVRIKLPGVEVAQTLGGQEPTGVFRWGAAEKAAPSEGARRR